MKKKIFFTGATNHFATVFWKRYKFPAVTRLNQGIGYLIFGLNGSHPLRLEISSEVINLEIINRGEHVLHRFITLRKGDNPRQSVLNYKSTMLSCSSRFRSTFTQFCLFVVNFRLLYNATGEEREDVGCPKNGQQSLRMRNGRGCCRGGLR